MKTLELSKQETADAVASLRRYCDENLEPIGELAGSLLLGYFLEEIGPLIYNRAVADAQARLASLTADLSGDLWTEPMGYWPRQDAKRRVKR